jgi:hypothetical protein
MLAILGMELRLRLVIVLILGLMLLPQGGFVNDGVRPLMRVGPQGMGVALGHRREQNPRVQAIEIGLAITRYAEYWSGIIFIRLSRGCG